MTVEKSPAMPVYVKDIFTDERFRALSLAEQGLYFWLLSHQWLEGSIPNDRNFVLRLTGQPSARRLWDAVIQFFPAHPTEPNRLANPKLEVVRAEMLEHRRRRAEAGAKGAAAKWQCQCDCDGNAIGDRDGNAIVLPHTKTCPAFAVASASSRKNPPVSPRKRGERKPTRERKEANAGGREVPEDVAREDRRRNFVWLRSLVDEWERKAGRRMLSLDDLRLVQEESGVSMGAYLELRDEFSDADLSPPLQLVHATTH